MAALHTQEFSPTKSCIIGARTPSISGLTLWFISVYPSFPWFPVIHCASPWFPVIVFFCLACWARSGTHRILSRHCEPHRGQSGPTDRTLTVGFIYSRDLLGNITTNEKDYLWILLDIYEYVLVVIFPSIGYYTKYIQI